MPMLVPEAHCVIDGAAIRSYRSLTSLTIPFFHPVSKVIDRSLSENWDIKRFIL